MMNTNVLANIQASLDETVDILFALRTEMVERKYA